MNIAASKLNTLELQRSIQKKADDETIQNNTKNFNNTFNTSPAHLSLIIAAGFSKGEIHVFDGFKKEASVFYNNNVKKKTFYFVFFF